VTGDLFATTLVAKSEGAIADLAEPTLGLVIEEESSQA